MPDVLLVLVLLVAAIPGLFVLLSPRYRNAAQQGGRVDEAVQASLDGLRQALGADVDGLRRRLDGLGDGAEVRALRARLEAHEERHAQIVERLQNLEAIVTSEAWDRLQRADDAELRLLLDDPADGLAAAPAEPDDAAKARRLAQRLR